MGFWPSQQNRGQHNGEVDFDLSDYAESDEGLAGDEEVDWPSTPQLTPEQVAAETLLLQAAMSENPGQLKELITLKEPRDSCLNLEVWVHNEFRGGLTLSGHNLDQQRHRLEQGFGVVTEPIEESYLAPFDGNLLVIYQIQLDDQESRLTVWFGPQVQQLTKLYLGWLSLSGDYTFIEGQEVLIVTSWD